MADPTPVLPEHIETIPDVLAYWSDCRPEAEALLASGGNSLSYAELWHRVAGISCWLGEHGVPRDSCVLVMAPEGLELAVAFLGAASAASAVVVDDTTPAPELDRLLHRLSVGGAIVFTELEASARDAFRRNSVPVFSLDEMLAEISEETATLRTPSDSGWTPPSAADRAVIGQTSGTTGMPKLIPRTHRRIVTSGRAHFDLYGLTPADRAVAVAPITVSLGTTTLLHTICGGASLVFPRSFAPQQVWDAIERERPTWIHASSGFLEELVRFLRLRPKPVPPSLRFVRVTAAPIAPAVCDELEGLLGAPLLPAYSTSETGAVCVTLDRPGWRKRGSAGRPVQEVRIVGTDGENLPSGEEGEIWIRGPKVIGEYLDDRELSSWAITADGWFRVGDVGYLDDEGFLFLTGRINELVNRGGLKISPQEVDSVLRLHPDVYDAATFAIPDDRLGQDIVAAVVPKGDTTLVPREIRRWMFEHLAQYKVPRKIWIVSDDMLVRTRSGKIRRAELARRYDEERSTPTL